MTTNKEQEEEQQQRRRLIEEKEEERAFEEEVRETVRVIMEAVEKRESELIALSKAVIASNNQTTTTSNDDDDDEHGTATTHRHHRRKLQEPIMNSNHGLNKVLEAIRSWGQVELPIPPTTTPSPSPPPTITSTTVQQPPKPQLQRRGHRTKLTTSAPPWIQQEIQQQQQQRPSETTPLITTTPQQQQTTTSFKDCTLIKQDQQQTLTQHIKPTTTPKEWTLIYRATRDGFTATDFHQHCDNKGDTIVIIKAHDCVFGGYNADSWDSFSGWKYNTNCFLFAMINPHISQPLIFTPITTTSTTTTGRGGGGGMKGTTYNKANVGAVFGGNKGFDIYVPEVGTKGVTNFNGLNGFKDTFGKGVLTFTRSRNFSISEIEVFSH